MSYVIKYGATDITNYIVEISDIPTIERNRDFTRILSEVVITASENWGFVTGTLGAKITIASASSSSYPFFIGYIVESTYDYERHVIVIHLSHFLSKLKNYIVKYSNLHTLISTSATAQQYRASDNEGYPSVQVIHLIQKMFDDAGIEIYLNGIKDLIVDSFVFGGSTRDIEVEHLRLDENMIYCLNQSTATYYTTIEADEEKRNAQITYWDFFQIFISCIGQDATEKIGFNLGVSASGTPEQIILYLRDNDPITSISNDYIYEKRITKIQGNPGGYAYNILFANRGDYAATAETALSDHKGYTEDGSNSIEWMTNLLFLYEKFWVTAGDTFGLTDYPLYNLKVDHFLYNKIKAVTEDYTTTKWVTSLQAFTRAKVNSYNLVDRTATIEQELES